MLDDANKIKYIICNVRPNDVKNFMTHIINKMMKKYSNLTCSDIVSAWENSCKCCYFEKYRFLVESFPYLVNQSDVLPFLIMCTVHMVIIWRRLMVKFINWLIVRKFNFFLNKYLRWAITTPALKEVGEPSYKFGSKKFLATTVSGYYV